MPVLLVVLLLSLLPTSRCSARPLPTRSPPPSHAREHPEGERCARRYRWRGVLPTVGVATWQRWRIPSRSLTTVDRSAGVQRARQETATVLWVRWQSTPRRTGALVLCGLLSAPALGRAQDATGVVESSLLVTTEASSRLSTVLARVVASTPHIDAVALLSRARRAGWMPNLLRFEARVDDGRRWDTESRLQQDYDDTSAFDGADTRSASGWVADRGVTARAQVGWDLSALVWSGEELAVLSATRAAERDQLQRISSATEAWLELHEARAALLSLSAADDRLEATAIIAQSIARLDVLTNGWFSQEFGPGL